MDLKHPQKTTKNNTSKQNPDGKTTSSSSYLTKYFKSLNLNQKVSLSQQHGIKQQALSKDTVLQAKSLASSVIVDSSSKTTSFINKSCPQHRKESSKMTKQVVCSSKDNKPKKKCPKEENSMKKATKMDVKDLRSSYDDVKKLSKMVNDYDDDDDDKSRRVSVRRRKSFCDSNVELAGIFASNGVKVVAVDMPPFMQIHAVDCARKTCDSLEKFTSKSLASTLKKEFDGVYGPAWHCIVGKSFGSFVTHSVGGFMYFSMDQKLYILLFKTTVLKAE